MVHLTRPFLSLPPFPWRFHGDSKSLKQIHKFRSPSLHLSKMMVFYQQKSHKTGRTVSRLSILNPRSRTSIPILLILWSLYPQIFYGSLSFQQIELDWLVPVPNLGKTSLQSNEKRRGIPSDFAAQASKKKDKPPKFVRRRRQTGKQDKREEISNVWDLGFEISRLFMYFIKWRRLKAMFGQGVERDSRSKCRGEEGSDASRLSDYLFMAGRRPNGTPRLFLFNLFDIKFHEQIRMWLIYAYKLTNFSWRENVRSNSILNSCPFHAGCSGTLNVAIHKLIDFYVNISYKPFQLVRVSGEESSIEQQCCLNPHEQFEPEHTMVEETKCSGVQMNKFLTSPCGTLKDEGKVV